MNFDRLSNIMNRLAEEISAYNSTLLTKFPINTYLGYIANYPEIGNYNYVSPKIKDYCNKIVKSSNEQILELYHQMILITLISKTKDKLKSMKLPEDVKAIYNVNIERIIGEIESNTGCYTYSEDSFCKKLATCTLRLIPVGTLKIHLSSIPKSFFIKNGVRQLVRGTTFTVFELGGFSPLYQFHIDSKDPDSMAKFSYNGYIHSFIRIAKILKKNTRVKGLFGVGWYIDPQPIHVSKRLSHIRELLISETDATLFYMGSSEHAIRDATSTSSTRRRMYEEGKYIPTDYFWVWPRQRLINWANGVSQTNFG